MREDWWPRAIEEPGELPWIEYTESQDWESAKVKCAKTALGMANTQDGGHIVVGVQERNGREYEVTGLTQEHEATWTDNNVRDYINSFADPGVRIDSGIREHEGKRFYVIDVDGLDRTPVIARQGTGNRIHKGVVYTRPAHGKAEVCPASESEWDNIIHIAAVHRFREFREQLETVELTITKRAAQAPPSPGTAYDAELEDLNG